MAPRQKHREPIVDAAVSLFRRQGYSSTGLNEIVDQSGAPKGSLYHYFPKGKVSIAVAAVEEAGKRIAETLEGLASEAASTGDMIRAHAQLLAGWMAKSGFRDGCPVTTVLLELAPQERAVSEAGRKAYKAQISVVRDKLVADGHLPARAGRLAEMCIFAIQGALVQSRVMRSGAPLISTADELARMIGSDRPAS